VLEIAIVTAMLLIAVAFAVFSNRAINHADSRDDVARHLFMAAFDGSNTPRDVLEHLFEALRHRVPAGISVFRPSDELAGLYGFSRLDAEDVALLVAARADGRIPTAHDLDSLDEHVRTVADLVRFVSPFCHAEGAPDQVALAS
jgi:hypothetical protein